MFLNRLHQVYCRSQLVGWSRAKATWIEEGSGFCWTELSWAELSRMSQAAAHVGWVSHYALYDVSKRCEKRVCLVQGLSELAGEAEVTGSFGRILQLVFQRLLMDKGLAVSLETQLTSRFFLREPSQFILCLNEARMKKYMFHKWIVYEMLILENVWVLNEIS